MTNSKCSKIQRSIIEKVCCDYTPVVITVCFVCAMLLVYVVGAKYNMVFTPDLYKDVFVYYGFTASLWKKLILLFFAVLSALPYVLIHRGKHTEQNFDSWVKLGLVLGIAICFYSAVAVMDDIYDFLVVALEGADSDVFRYGRPLYITYTQQNRFILTIPQNILLPLSMCMLLHFLKGMYSGNRIVTVICIFLTIWGIYYLNSGLWFLFTLWKGVVLLCFAIVIGCISSMCQKKDTGSNEKLCQSGWYGILIIGIIMLVLCMNVVLKLFMHSFGLFQGAYALTESDQISLAVIAFALSVALIYTFCAKKLGSPTFRTGLQLLPSLFLVMIGFATNCCLTGFHLFVNSYSYNFGAHYYFIWFFDCIACLIYVLYVLYDYGMKEHPKLYLGITAFLIVMAHIPNSTIPIGSGIESVSIINILFGLLSPVLIITFGMINGRKTRELRN